VLLDVKCGDGAFMKNVDEARALARAMVTIGRLGGIPTEAFVTDMDAPLGNAIGNTLEMIECFDTLKGTGPAALTAVVTRLAARMVVLAGVERDTGAATARVEDVIASGHALQTLTRMIDRQGGDARVIEDYGLMPSAPDRELVTAPRAGFVTRLAAQAIGRAAHVLGAGRSKVGEPESDHGRWRR
jgi:thymidine phosphorylase